MNQYFDHYLKDTERWLANFAYHIHVDFTYFLSVGITTLAILLLTISYHVIKTVFTNPVISLRQD